MAKGYTATQLISQADEAYSKQGNWTTLWQECVDYADPSHDGISALRAIGTEEDADRLIDIVIQSLNEYSSGLYAFLCVGDWTKLGPENKKDLENKSIAGWWNDVSSLMLAKIESSNFKQEIVQCFRSLGSIGTSNILTELIDGELVFRFFDITEYAIDEDNRRMIDTVYRKMEFTAKQAVQEFGVDKLNDKIVKAYEKNDNTTKFHFYHIVLPRKSTLLGKRDKKNKAVASYYVDIDNKEIVDEGGYDTMPYAVARAMKSKNEMYGRSSTSHCLATARSQQHSERTIKDVDDIKSKPNWIVDKQSQVENLSNAKDEVTYWNSRKSQYKPERLNEQIELGITYEERKDKNQWIREAFFLDIFDALKDYRNMTALEAQERVSSSISKIAPMSSRIVNEGLRPLVERVFLLLLDDNQLPKYPEGFEMPQKFSVAFYGKLSQIAEEIQLGNISEGLNFALQYIEVFPEIRDWINSDEIPKYALTNSRAPSIFLHSEEDVMKEREARQAQAAQEKAIATGNAAADMIAKTGTKPEEGSPAQALIEGGLPSV